MDDLKLLSIRPSTREGKKYDATFKRAGRTKTTSFGAKGYDDFTKTKDTAQKERYIKRHSRGGENWADPTSAGALSRYILWGDSTSILTNISNYKKRFNL